ncbi:MAG: hypothetical protein IJ806_03980 [Ruminococcus sp.]|nr:hypothetical protein [Ruminococcus sp.]
MKTKITEELTRKIVIAATAVIVTAGVPTGIFLMTDNDSASTGSAVYVREEKTTDTARLVRKNAAAAENGEEVMTKAEEKTESKAEEKKEDKAQDKSGRDEKKEKAPAESQTAKAVETKSSEAPKVIELGAGSKKTETRKTENGKTDTKDPQTKSTDSQKAAEKTKPAVTSAPVKDEAPAEVTAAKPAETKVPEESAPAQDTVISYEDLHMRGLANRIDENRLYALYSDEGSVAMGNVYYKVYTSSDNGKTWVNENKTISVPNGTMTCFALDNGDLVFFRTSGADIDGLPKLTMVSFDWYGVPFSYEASIDLDMMIFGEHWDVIKDISDTGLRFEPMYLGGSTLRIYMEREDFSPRAWSCDIDLY